MFTYNSGHPDESMTFAFSATHIDSSKPRLYEFLQNNLEQDDGKTLVGIKTREGNVM